jgi:alpha-tubulin suppressor-like RCC1 family protein
VASFGARTCARSSAGIVKCFGKTAAENTIASANSYAGLLGKCYMRNADGAGLFACTGQNLPAIDVGDKAGDMAALSPVDFGSGAQVKKLVAGLTFTCAQMNDNSVMCFGKGNQGQLGVGASFISDVPYGSNAMPPQASIPAQAAGASEWVVDIAAGDNHSCYVTNLNKVKCFGAVTSNATGTNKLPNPPVLQINSAASAPTVYSAP